MTAVTREQLKAEIRATFGSVAFPSHQGLRGSMALDRYATTAEVESITASQDVHGEWWQIPQEELRSCLLALSYLDAAGTVFYLPAYLDMALDDVGKRRLSVLDLLDVAIGDDDPEPDPELRLRAYLEERLCKLDLAQRKICMRALQFLRSQLRDDDPSTEFERRRIDGVVNDRFWLAFKD